MSEGLGEFAGLSGLQLAVSISVLLQGMGEAVNPPRKRPGNKPRAVPRCLAIVRGHGPRAHAHKSRIVLNDGKMAESSSTSTSSCKFYCEFCQLGFNFASKYHLHLRSSRHCALEAIYDDLSHENDTPMETATDHSTRGMYLATLSFAKAKLVCSISMYIVSLVRFVLCKRSY